MEKELICEMTIVELEKKIKEIKKELYSDEMGYSHEDFITRWEDIKNELKSRELFDENQKIQVFKGEYTIPGSTQNRYGLILQPSVPKEKYPSLNYQQGATSEKSLVPSQFAWPDAVKFPEVVMMCMLAAKNINIFMGDYPCPGHDMQHGQSFISSQSLAESVLFAEIYVNGTVPAAF